ncbi:ABC transporter ATP-binding protein [Streptomonospora nanhaiensis]|uniref:Putative ABC transport system ATP-binding protein n=1 Tax=Streptomonospora nanhaiensis TaxID=1323731 RepID=A0A853BJ06_9ACTN|nr:ABC transporter ATP-binding protein [Streptomonospora nanhaiensis]MBX9389709.1 ABC transporter ATP-binding protein [Streptomonospora nanhaiensis]NYI94562.1 putative ABC transport system ATP-binding protein [Streptomonospora nanhaiensis]
MALTAPTTPDLLAAGDPGDLAAYAEQVSKVYGRGDSRVAALDAITLGVPKGRFTAIMGPSGSGKSTLMHCLAGLDRVTSGRVVLGGTDLTRLNERALTRLRRDRVGFVFQAFNLVPTLTALENITLPADIAGRRLDRAWLDELIDSVGLRDRLRHRPSELSGGQQQRVACARALAARPDVVFADEPTGNLDSRSGREVLGLLRDSARRTGQSVVMVTHDPAAAAYADLVVFLSDGRVAGQLAHPDQNSVLERMKHLDPGEDTAGPGGPGGGRP